jgi:hypothetical protein
MSSGEDLFWDKNQQASDSKDLSRDVKSAKIEPNSIHEEKDKIDEDINSPSKSAKSKSARTGLHKIDESSINIPKLKSIDIEELNETQRDQSNPINGN